MTGYCESTAWLRHPKDPFEFNIYDVFAFQAGVYIVGYLMDRIWSGSRWVNNRYRTPSHEFTTKSARGWKWKCATQTSVVFLGAPNTYTLFCTMRMCWTLPQSQPSLAVLGQQQGFWSDLRGRDCKARCGGIGRGHGSLPLELGLFWQHWLRSEMYRCI